MRSMVPAYPRRVERGAVAILVSRGSPASGQRGRDALHGPRLQRHRRLASKRLTAQLPMSSSATRPAQDQQSASSAAHAQPAARPVQPSSPHSPAAAREAGASPLGATGAWCQPPRSASTAHTAASRSCCWRWLAFRLACSAATSACDCARPRDSCLPSAASLPSCESTLRSSTCRLSRTASSCSVTSSTCSSCSMKVKVMLDTASFMYFLLYTLSSLSILSSCRNMSMMALDPRVPLVA
mmetsp:Transcript_535/g.1259  ORF Transcript_535/g.1259 Transcript_535/m.1259 type:complete len:240 (-) Transcript_535:159-878(-)